MLPKPAGAAFTQDPVTETVGSPQTPRRIYAYTVVGKDKQAWTRTVGSTAITGEGLVKVGETTKDTAKARVKEQLGTAFPGLVGVDILLDVSARRSDGTYFRDHAVHKALAAAGVRRVGREWFEATVEEVQAAIASVRSGTTFDSTRIDDFPMRPEQEDAVALTAAYFAAHAPTPRNSPRFLWNAKMRFGKTFTAYQLARELGWTRVLVLTYKPAVQASWRADLVGHVDFEDWRFVDRTTSSADMEEAGDSPNPLIWFASFQDLIGKTAGGQVKAHNETIHLTDWDCIVLDEYHFGAWRDSARDLYDPTDVSVAEEEEPDQQITEDDLGLTAAHYLYLSGTPFRAITNGEFTEDQVFNWTYPQEQEAKAAWDESRSGPNPYADLPGMTMYCYEIGQQALAWAEDGEFNRFSLSDYFKAARVDPQSRSFGSGSFGFEDPTRVSEFLEMLRGKLPEQMKQQVLAAGKKAPFPYESPDFKATIRNSVWYMPDVASCYAMRDCLAAHAYFGKFEIVVAAGTKAGQGAAAKPPVDDGIADGAKGDREGSITLSCGKLMTGVTLPEWGAILMLRSLRSPETYFQAAFRVQSPWRAKQPDATVRVLKDRCFVFEFDPNRALSLVAEYGLRLSAGGDASPSQVIGQLLDYLPIYTFAGGAMTKLDAAEVMDWASAGIGATALAQRWNSPVLVDVNEATLSALLEHPDLLAALEQIEDFRNLAQTANQIVTSTKALKKAKRAQGGQLDPEQKKAQSETAKARKEIREKLQKFVAKVPVFMYVTDFREEALKDVIESLDSTLFERVTGLTVEDFRLLNRIGVFNAQHMNQAIYQFKAFETRSLHYADEDRGEQAQPGRVGLWDRTEILSSSLNRERRP